MLVVGMRGWPLLESGKVTRKLADAERLRAGGARVRIVCEEEFREILGLDACEAAGEKTLSAGQVAGTLGVEESVLERWEQLGLVRSHGGRYDFRDLVSLRTVTGLVARGVSPVVIRRSLDGLRGLLPGIDRPLAQLSIMVSDSGKLVAELEEALVAPCGQMEIRFRLEGDERGHKGAGASLSLAADQSRTQSRGGDDWIEAGLRHERAGELAEAEAAYRRAAAAAPGEAGAQFNLGNVLLATGRLEAAAERYAQAVALDPLHARAWFNLAHVNDEIGRRAAALRFLRRAIEADPGFADAHYNLAILAEGLGEKEAAEGAWQEYVRLDPASEWAEEARRRLKSLRSRAWA
jgi:Flp pilus assembly protein TadD